MHALSRSTLGYLLLVAIAAVTVSATAIYQSSVPMTGDLSLAMLLGVLELLVK